MNLQTPMGDKEVLSDALSSQKFETVNYNMFAYECATPEIRNELLSILDEEHDIQNELFIEMSQRGWYPVPPADQQKIDQAKQRFCPDSQ